MMFSIGPAGISNPIPATPALEEGVVMTDRLKKGLLD